MERKKLRVKEVLEALAAGNRFQSEYGHYEYEGGYDPMSYDEKQEKKYVSEGFKEINAYGVLSHLQEIFKSKVNPLNEHTDIVLFEPKSSYILTVIYEGKTYTKIFDDNKDHVIRANEFIKKIGIYEYLRDVKWTFNQVIMDKDL